MQRASYVKQRLVGDPLYSHVCIEPTDHLPNDEYEDFHYDPDLYDPKDIPVGWSIVLVVA